MKHVALTLLSLLLLGPSVARAEGAVRCLDERASCREGCTLEFGTSFRLREKLGVCLQSCGRDFDRCEASFNQAIAEPAKKEVAPKPKVRPRPAQAVVPKAKPVEVVIDRNTEELPVEPVRAAPPREKAVAIAAPPRTVSPAPAPPAPLSTRAPSKKKRDLFNWDPGDLE